MKLNLGCGDRYQDGWHNVDFAGSPHKKDQEFDLRNPVLPWDSVSHAFLGHVLEHLYVDEALALLSTLRSCLRVDGELMVVGPDVIFAQELQATGQLDTNTTMDSLINGGHRWEGDEHRWHCTARAIEALLRVTHWTNVAQVNFNEVPEFWPVADRGPRWQCAVSARP